MKLPVDTWDVIAVAGALVVCWGCYLIYPPLAPIIFGGGLLALALGGASRWGS